MMMMMMAMFITMLLLLFMMMMMMMMMMNGVGGRVKVSSCIEPNLYNLVNRTFLDAKKLMPEAICLANETRSYDVTSCRQHSCEL